MKPLLKTGASISTLETQNFPVKSTLPANLGYHIVDSSQFGYYPDEDKIKEMTKERHYALVLAAQDIMKLLLAKEKGFAQARTLLLPALTDAPGERKM
ncbi:hypothetical protein AFCA_012979 [Aspergillus flavus]|nr:hypothetical protein AFCA_012979 [Aspergillus flavus]